MKMAMRSAVRLLPAEFCSLPDMIRRITGIEVEAIRGMQRECQMYVLTNARKLHGANIMLYKEYLEIAAKKMNGDFYILPSSIHELLAVPVSTAEIEELRQMVKEVNDNEVAPEEILGYEVIDTTEKPAKSRWLCKQLPG